MDEIKLVNRDILETQPALSWLAQQDVIPEPFGYRIGYSLHSVERTSELIQKQAGRLGKRLADLDEDGKPKTRTFRGVEQYVITEREEEHEEEMERLMAEETTLRCATFKRADFDFKYRDAEGKERQFIVPGMVWKGLLPLLVEG